MSRGGTKRSRAQQDKKRRAKQRTATAKAAQQEKKEPKKKQGRAKAVLLHIMSLFAPLLLAGGAFFSGQTELDYSQDPPVPQSEAWPGEALFGSSFAEYWREPRGLLLFIVALSLAAAIFWLLMVVGWKRLYRSTPLAIRDWSSVDQSITLMAVASGVWVLRGVFGYQLLIQNLLFMVLLLSLYVPLFSAALALILPVVPGSGRIGGVLPDALKFSFTRRYLLSDEEREEADEAAAAIKAAREAERAAADERRREKKARKRSSK